jgi:hypothetical protein
MKLNLQGWFRVFYDKSERNDMPAQAFTKLFLALALHNTKNKQIILL